MDRRWKAIAWTNLVLGVLLWLGYVTDYSWRGTLTDFLFAPMVGVVAIASLLLKCKGPSKRTRRLYKLACLPGAVGGGLVIICMALAALLLVIFPPLILGVMFGVAEHRTERVIQEAVSPEGSRVAAVYFRDVGAYTGGYGRVDVRVRYRWMPAVERDVFHTGRSYSDKGVSEYVRWKDADTLQIVGERYGGDELKVGVVAWEVPAVIQLPVNLVRFVCWEVKSEMERKRMREEN